MARKLQLVNDFFNRKLNYLNDIVIWKETDYWATPVESLLKGKADCEDFAIGKYFMLRWLGVEAESIRISYVNSLKFNQPHMVLSFYQENNDTPLILDNILTDIRSARVRKDLEPVYAFNAIGLYLPDGDSERYSRDASGLSRWQDLLNKMNSEGFDAGKG